MGKESQASGQANRFGLPRLPPNQQLTAKFPVMTYGPTPVVADENWHLEIDGLVSEKKRWSRSDLDAFPQTSFIADFHCVTHWSRYDDEWTGVLFRDFFEEIRSLVDETSTHVMQHAFGGYTTNLPLARMLEEEVLIAHTLNGAPLPPEHGGPVRIFTPRRYGWKGAKWIRSFEFMDADRPGFWEKNGYHMDADPWKEERYWD